MEAYEPRPPPRDRRNDQDFQAWGLDALGNWATFTDQGVAQDRDHDAANQITDIAGQAGWVTPGYDAAGNMTSGPRPGQESARLHFTYDAWNRLAAVYADDQGDPGDLIAEYQYDGQGRRAAKIVRTVQNEQAVYVHTDYLYNESRQCLAEHKEGNPTCNIAGNCTPQARPPATGETTTPTAVVSRFVHT